MLLLLPPHLFQKNFGYRKMETSDVSGLVGGIMKKIFFSLGLPKNYIVKIQLRKLINTLRFMTYQKDCIYLLNKFRRNSYLEKCVQNSKKGWLYVTYDDRLSILGQRNSHTPLDIICSIARVHSNKSGKFLRYIVNDFIK